jgi:diaminopimelate decarboxylase
MSYEAHTSTDLQTVGRPIKRAIENFATRTGRKLKLEIEPGTFLMANSGALLTTVQDMATTGGAQGEGHVFLKLDSGMTDVIRPSLYGSQHPIVGLKPPPAADAAVAAGTEATAGMYCVCMCMCERVEDIYSASHFAAHE